MAESSQKDIAVALLKKRKSEAKPKNKDSFSGLVGVYLGADTKMHYPKLKDEQGKNVQDEHGHDMRAEQSDGYTHIFSELGTSKRIEVVLPRSYTLEPLSLYQVSGLGYDISKSSMYFIDEAGKVAAIRSTNE